MINPDILGRSTSEPTPNVKISWLGRSSPSSFMPRLLLDTEARRALVENQIDRTFDIAQGVEAGEHFPPASRGVFEQADCGTAFRLVSEAMFLLCMNPLQPLVSSAMQHVLQVSSNRGILRRIFRTLL